MSESQSHSDLLMMFVGPSGNIDGESMTRFNDAEGNPTPDRLTRDFRKGKFFEIKSFELEFEVSDRPGGTAGGGGSAKKGGSVVHLHVHPSANGGGAGGAGVPGSNQPFSGWLNTGVTEENGKKTLSLQVNACKVTRYVDVASPKLFQLCTSTKSLKQAVIVARRAGGLASGSTAYFRLEFGDRNDARKGVVINNLTWEYEDGLITEQLSFYYRKLMVYYVPQTMTGQHSVEITGSWEWSMQAQGGDE